MKLAIILRCLTKNKGLMVNKMTMMIPVYLDANITYNNIFYTIELSEPLDVVELDVDKEF